jgi:hypothetical protein
MAADYIGSRRPDFCLVGFRYRAVLENGRSRQGGLTETDGAVGTLLNTMSLFGLFNQYHISLVGLPESAGRTDSKEKPVTPWIICGPGIAADAGGEGRPCSILDIVPTLSRLMGLRPCAEWTGRAFQWALDGDACEGVSRGCREEVLGDLECQRTGVL